MNWVLGRYSALFYSLLCTAGLGTANLLGFTSLSLTTALTTASILSALGLYDLFQKQSSVRANFPIIGRLRYFFESIRPELRQYFWEADDAELPYSRNQRAMVYQRAKSEFATRPFGSIESMYEEDFSWLNHSIVPIEIEAADFPTRVGLGDNAYDVSLLNISGTSFGALSPPAIEALNLGAALGGFAQNTGEGSVSPYHIRGKGDLILQVSTGYFGFRTPDGKLDESLFTQQAARRQIKMIEIKLSQGAKPGHGGMLPAAKVNREIATTRGIPEGQDCISPAKHSAFDSPESLLMFADRLRTLSEGKPVGIKLCIGHPWELIAIVKAMVTTGIALDFITVDGAEGGTGAAPAEFSDHLGCPLTDALVFVDNALRGAGLRDRVKIAASGKLVSAFDIVKHCALGADWINMARPFMFALGCIQARNCASGLCPTGIATMDPSRYRVLDVELKAQRVANFHRNTLAAVGEMIGAAGIKHPVDLNRRHIVRRLSGSEILLADQIYPNVSYNQLFTDEPIADPRLAEYWSRVNIQQFSPITPS
ncbi:MAG: FMN-binding glutamate synthase family protein [Pseudomonadales bacterium]|jgi:glutamate synthase domain-containing protein 2|nr:FMN-binding glutamate synthase family protein [Pseudomonadales bacterium]MDA0760436.1 FMN-binding glutamate synthase family protein [Pseudomonadota bacterium]MDA0957011.1 FMN-binding glutamate synthase family protein [Pseudomonadota bacterium]